MLRRYARGGDLRGKTTWGIVWFTIATSQYVGPVVVRAADHANEERVERRVLSFLATEVPQWFRENHCYSCHNNGDAARALFAAKKLGVSLPEDALRDTIAFLERPERWDKNGVDAAFSDKRLARLQFANALAAAVDANAIGDRSVLLNAAARLVVDQAPDGSWNIDEVALIGSPATYGAPLATALARRTLLTADADRFAGPIRQAGRWLQARPVRNTLDVAAILIGLKPTEVPSDLRVRCLDLIRKGRSTDGGWGPFPTSPPEAFDTAITLLALSRWPAPPPEVASFIQGGRSYLVANQAEDGSWPETTRPTGGESYAQRLSTTGWVALALLATD
ncbi:hypothetical protein SAMN05444166_6331 [Singulisphaera sp. GP187]|uniref:hypothetical protein n=1 Tax=Singulisphaera sp. GP187 TaxID=1882752 RepID=UPI00092ABD54|nr:hypothetical protein [Singulisphaera sp. GP187]SIO60267.1 hypothetical protein SAMN05444166_6331 [Singulisphaera sp. GP187]